MSWFLQLGFTNAVCAAVLALVAAVVTRFCPRRPALVHCLWLLVLVKLVTPPLFFLHLPWLPTEPTTSERGDRVAVALQVAENVWPEQVEVTPMPVPPPTPPVLKLDDLIEGKPLLPPALAPIPSLPEPELAPHPVQIVPVPSSNPAPAMWSVVDLLPVLGGVWLLGSLLWFARAGWHIALFQRLLRHARPAPEQLQAEANRLARSLGLKTSPLVYLLPGPLSPLVWATFGRARLFFPARLLDRLGEEQRASLLLHELAHIVRGDHRVRWLELIATGLYWWYPVVWWARRQIEVHEEECCDAWVVSELPPRVYAGAILETVEFLADTGCARSAGERPVLASGLSRLAVLKQRLARIMQATTPKRLSWFGWAAVLLVASLLLPFQPMLAQAEKPAEAETRSDSAPEHRLAPFDADPLMFDTRSANLVGGPNDVFAVAWSPDGKRFAVGSGRWDRPGELRLYDAAAEYRQLQIFFVDRGVASLAFSPNGKWLAEGCYDGQTRLRDAGTGEVLATMQHGSVSRVAFSPDGKILATVTESKQAQLWEVPSGRELAKLEGDLFRFHHVAFSHNGKLLAAAGGDWQQNGISQVTVWDVATRKQKMALKGHQQAILTVAFSPDDLLIATGGLDAAVRLWDVASGTEKAVLQGHSSWVEGVAFSPDGKMLASSGQDGTARLWDVVAGKELATLEGFPTPTRGLAFAPDGKTLAVGAGQKTVRLFDAGTRKEIKTVQQVVDQPETAGAILDLDVRPDGRIVATALESGAIQLRDVPSGDLRHVLLGHEDAVTCVAWSPDGKVLASGSPDKTIRLWDPEQGKELKSLKGHTSWVYALAWSPDGKSLVSGGYDKTVRVWDAIAGKEQAVLKGHKASVRAVAFSQDGKTVASGGGDRSVKLWNVADGIEKTSWREHEGTIRALAFSPDGKSLAGGAEDGNVVLWDLETGTVRITVGETKTAQGAANPAEVWALAFTPQGNTLITAASNGLIRIWDPVTGQNRGTLNGHNNQGVTAVAFGPSARFLLSGGQDRMIKLWTSSPAPLQAQATLRAFTHEVWFATYSPVAPVLATGGKDKLVRLWRLPAGFPGPAFQARTSHIIGTAFAPDGKTLATAHGDRTVKLWDPTTRKVRMTLDAQKEPVRGLAFSPDGKWIATGSGDWDAPGREGEVILWAADTGKQVRRLGAHADLVFQVAFSRDGRTLASASRDRTVRLWDVDTGDVRATLTGHREAVRTLAFSPDGNLLATGSWDATVRLWDVATAKESHVLTTNLNKVTGVAFAPSGKQLAVTGIVTTKPEAGVVQLWDVERGKVKTTLEGRYAGPGVAVAFSPDGKTLVTGSGRWGSIGEVNLYDPVAGSLLGTVHLNGAMVEALAFSKDGRRLACGSGLPGGVGELRMWDMNPGPLMREIGEHDGIVSCGNFSADGKLLVTGGMDRMVRIWDVETGRSLKEFKAQEAPVRAVGFSPDGRWLATGGQDKTARIWDWEAGTLKHKLIHRQNVTRLAWSPDGRWLVTGAGHYQNDPGGEVQVWDPTTGDEKAKLEGHTKHIVSIAFAPDGKSLATGCADGKARIWDVPSFQLRKMFENRGSPQGMTFSSDSKTLATGLWIPDNSQPAVASVRLYDTTTWVERATLSGHTKFLWTVSFAPGNRTLASGSMDGTVKLWTVPGMATGK